MKIKNCLLIGCMIATLCSCNANQNGMMNVTLSKDILFDKVKGAWAGQIIGPQPDRPSSQGNALCIEGMGCGILKQGGKPGHKRQILSLQIPGDRCVISKRIITAQGKNEQV